MVHLPLWSAHNSSVICTECGCLLPIIDDWQAIHREVCPGRGR